MQQTLAKLFGRSPFTPLKTHMAKVAACVDEIPALFAALKKRDYVLVEKVAMRISELEHQADLVKNDIRNHLPMGLFLPVARTHLLEILSLQDNIADFAEDLAVLVTFRPLEIEPLIAAEFDAMMYKNLETVRAVNRIIQELDELLESSFGGSEAEKVKCMVADVAFKEHEADLIQRSLLKKFFCEQDKMAPPLFYLWMQVLHAISRLSDESEKLANRVRMTLEVQ